MRTTYSEAFKVRSYETDTRGRLQVPILCQLLEQAAVAHAAILGVAVESLIDSGVAWVLSRLHLQMDRWPRADEGIEIETWPEAASRLFTERRFEIRESTGRRIGSVSTLWFVLNLERRRPIRLPHQVSERLSEHELGLEPRKFSDLDVPEPIDNELGFTVRRSDLDLADHVNNTSYVEWAIEAVPDEVWGLAELTEFEIHYLSECHHGESVVSQSQIIDHGQQTEVRHQLRRSDDDAEVARARSVWQMR